MDVRNGYFKQLHPMRNETNGIKLMKYICDKLKNKNALSICCIMGAAVIYALSPLFLHIGQANQAPFIFNSVRSLFAAFAIIVFLFVFYRSHLFDGATWSVIFRNWKKLSLLVVLLGNFDYAILGWSLKYIDISVASILYETWPLWMIFLTGLMFGKKARYEKIGIFGWVYILIAILGMVFVVSSQHGGLPFNNESGTLFNFMAGVGLALLSALLGAMIGGCSIKWGVDVAKKHKRLERLKNKTNYTCQFVEKKKIFQQDLSLFFISIAALFGNIFTFLVVSILSGSLPNTEIVEFKNMVVAAIYGFFILTTAQTLFRVGNILTSKLEINAIFYMTPALTIVWLWIFDYINVAMMEWLVWGTAGIIMANIFLNFKNTIPSAPKNISILLWLTVGVALL